MKLSLLFISFGCLIWAVALASEDRLSTEKELSSLANPNTDLGFADDAIAVGLPDSHAIQSRLSDAQEEQIVRKTLADVDRVYANVELPGGTDDDRIASNNASEDDDGDQPGLETASPIADWKAMLEAIKSRFMRGA